MRLQEIQSIVEEDGIIFLAYGSVLTQDIIASFASALEKDAMFSQLGLHVSSDIFTVFIEVSQNLLMYSRQHQNSPLGQGIIVLGRNQEGMFYVHSRNLVTAEDKELLTRRLQPIISMDRESIRKTYREFRRNGRQAHHGGAGIGFYEIAKRCEHISFAFDPADENRYYYIFRSYISGEGRGKP